MNTLISLVRDEKGAAMVEYAVLLGLIAIVSIGIITTLGTNVSAVFNQINNSMAAA